jgi:hypothetical protein
VKLHVDRPPRPVLNDADILPSTAMVFTTPLICVRDMISMSVRTSAPLRAQATVLRSKITKGRRAVTLIMEAPFFAPSREKTSCAKDTVSSLVDVELDLRFLACNVAILSAVRRDATRGLV